MRFRDWFSWFSFKPVPAAPAAPEPRSAITASPSAAPEARTLRPVRSGFPWLKITPQPADARLAAVLEIDSAEAYPYWIALLEVPKDELDQFWVETAYQCIKLDAQAAIVETVLDPRTANKSSEIRFTRADEWALARFPPGRGLNLATKGKEARRHYVRIRGRMPF